MVARASLPGAGAATLSFNSHAKTNREKVRSLVSMTSRNCRYSMPQKGDNGIA